MTKLLELKLDLISKMKVRLNHKQDKFDKWLDTSDCDEYMYELSKKSEIDGYQNAVNDLEKILQEKLDYESEQKEIKLKIKSGNPKSYNPFKEWLELQPELKKK
jgi:DNA-binding transcriptional regulator GbsR (MarR family)|tara:strand:+ start:187 stop:498 length:312 start_codon:yes stop_codon:yes gene_type:complete